MIFKQYILKDDDEILSSIDGLDVADVVLKDYFYFTDKSIASGNIYSEKQVARILNITDKEYASLVNQYLHKAETSDNSGEKKRIQNKIDELNLKIKKSKDVEEAKKKIVDVNAQIERIDKELNSINEIDRKLTDANNEFKNYNHLSKFNLQKIHEDLVGINSQIEGLEEDLLNKKVVDIKKAKKKFVFDQGKIGLAMGIVVGMGIFGAIFWLIQAPFWIPLVVWGLGIFGALFLIVFSRYEVEVGEDRNVYDAYQYQDLNDLLTSLRSQRDNILRLLNLRNTNDFFLMKAKFSSIKKSLEYLNNERSRLSENMNYSNLQGDKNKLLEQKTQIESLLNSQIEVLPSDKYLEIYRELDSLKQSLNNISNNQSVKLEEIPKKLEEIRKELTSKLPTYSQVLKSTYEKNYDKISAKVADLIEKYKIPAFVPTKELTEWDSLSLTQKLLLEYSLATEIYKNNFVILVEELRNFGVEGILLTQGIINDSVHNTDGELIILDYTNVL